VECFLYISNEVVVANVSGTDNNHVFTEEVGCSVVSEVINGEVGEVIGVSLNRLAHHVVSEGVVVGVLECSILIVFVVVCVLTGDHLLSDFELSSIHRGVAEGIAHDADSTFDIILEDSHLDVGLFAACFS
jgi:hypothetical protein